jgi:hypothetical protein
LRVRVDRAESSLVEKQCESRCTDVGTPGEGGGAVVLGGCWCWWSLLSWLSLLLL